MNKTPFVATRSFSMNLENWTGQIGIIEVDENQMAFRICRPNKGPGDVFWLLADAFSDADEDLMGDTAFFRFRICWAGQSMDNCVGSVLKFATDDEWFACSSCATRDGVDAYAAAAALVAFTV